MKITREMFKPRVSIPIILCGIILFWSFAAFGEEWTKPQKEVWSVIEKRWEKIKEGDYNFVKAQTHDDAFIWFRGINTPLGKFSIMPFYGQWIKHSRPVNYELKPYVIQIFGDIANVMFAVRWNDGQNDSDHGRALTTFKKESGKWRLISSLGASCENLLNCSDW
jgi:hypothetical protein